MNESQDHEAIILPSLMSYRDVAYHDFVPPPASAIETRAARRRRRRIVTGAALAVALIGVSTILLARPAPPEGGPPVISSPSPSVSSAPPNSPGAPASGPEVIPATAMLTGLDLWDGGGAVVDGETSGEWTLAGMVTANCANAKPLNYPEPPPARSGYRDRTLKKAGITVIERVELSSELRLRVLMQWNRDLINDCAAVIGQATGVLAEIIGEGFAGDESLMVRHGTTCWVLVRQGPVTAQIMFKGGETVAEMRSAATKAASRMSRAA